MVHYLLVRTLEDFNAVLAEEPVNIVAEGHAKCAMNDTYHKEFSERSYARFEDINDVKAILLRKLLEDVLHEIQSNNIGTIIWKYSPEVMVWQRPMFTDLATNGPHFDFVHDVRGHADTNWHKVFVAVRGWFIPSSDAAHGPGVRFRLPKS